MGSDKLPPHNIEAEQSLLGSLLVNPANCSEVADYIKPDDFYLSKHGDVFKAILALYNEDRQHTDIVAIEAKLRQNGDLQGVGGMSALIGLANIVPDSFNVMEYADIVKSCAKRRRIIAAASRMATLAYDESQPLPADTIEQHMIDVLEDGQRHKDIKEQVSDYIDYLGKRLTTGKVDGVESSIKALNDILGCYRNGEVTIIAGRPGHGKSSLARTEAVDMVLKRGLSVALFSYEMNSEQIINSMVSAITGIENNIVESGRVDPAITNRAAGMISESKLSIFTDNCNTVGKIKAICKRLQQSRKGLDVIMIDHVGLLEATKRFGSSSNTRNLELSEMSRYIKTNIAGGLNVPVILLSQLSRACESRQDKRPMLSDLRDSGGLEQDAGAVVFLYRDVKYNPNTDLRNVIELDIAKNRYGRTGPTRAYFHEETSSVRNLKTSEIVL